MVSYSTCSLVAYDPSARQISTGHLVNLTTTDVERFQYGGTFINYLWGAPVESLVILYFGLDLVGVSFFAGFAALALMVPMQVCACVSARARPTAVLVRVWIGRGEGSVAGVSLSSTFRFGLMDVENG